MPLCLLRKLLPFVLALGCGVALSYLLGERVRVLRDVLYLERGPSTAEPARVGGEAAEFDNGAKARTPLVIYSLPSAAYTREARRRGFEGSISLTATFNPNWTVTDIEPAEWVCVYGSHLGKMSLPYGLTEEAVRAASRARFEPATEDGRAVPVTVEINCTFGRVQGGPRVGFCLPRKASAPGGGEWPIEFQVTSLHE